MAPWGIYVHVPFCAKRCPYCHFVLVESDGSLHERFVGRVCREIEDSPHRPPEVASLYFGGGTPSMLEPAQVARIVEKAWTVLGAPRGEVALEANPDGLTRERLEGYRGAGINRLSLGVQALDDGELRALGRTHTTADAREAYRLSCGVFEDVGVDLIFGLPGQDFGRTLDRVLEWSPTHVSLYGLTYEPGTEFARRRDRGEMKPLEPGHEAEMYSLAMDRLGAAGYRHYELSNFAKPGFESRHNLGYWDGRPYLGFGPGAHSYVPHRRWWNLSNVNRYLDAADPVMGSEELTEGQRVLERIFLGLRRDVGVDLLAFQEEFGVGLLTRFRPQVAELGALGLVEVEEGRFRLTRKGRLVADAVTARFA
ncbi:MAG: radical SAM family heme chaperone HemW [Planctomycetes bacterium]|nr:radical SAM family heme chaperone HemW [Planctomycetota bacterium]